MATTEANKIASPTVNEATLTSPDGEYKTVVKVGTMEATQLQNQGWLLGDAGKQILDIQSALAQTSPTKEVIAKA